MPGNKKAELIEGVVYMASPLRIDYHGTPHVHLNTWLGAYAAYTPGVRPGDNSTVRLDLDNEPQPDVLLMIEPSHGGQAMIDEGYVTGAPELVAEVASSTASIDLGQKKTAYRRNRTQEYLVWRVLDDAVDWFILRGTSYELLIPDSTGTIRSEVFPGLWLDSTSLLNGDLAAVLAKLQSGLATPEHKAFVEKLAQCATKKSS
jgi:Uma2 family endonuclease